jgi:hypothetical protein
MSSEFKYSVEIIVEGKKVVKKTNDFKEYQEWLEEDMSLNESQTTSGRQLLKG